MSIDPASLPTLPGEQDQNFASIREKGALYVDKTRFIQQMVSDHGHTYLCTRPRQFGKTLMVSTIESFLQGKKSLFKGLDIEAYMESEAFSEQPVLRFDMKTIPYNEGISKLKNGLLREVEKNAINYELTIQDDHACYVFIVILCDIYMKRGPVTLLIDDYDYPVANTLHDKKFHDEVCRFFHDFYNIIKAYDSRGYFETIFITGISESVKYAMGSSMNYIANVSSLHCHNTMFGFTEEELCTYFDGYISAATENMSMQQELLMEKIRNYCDSHLFGGDKKVYNPALINKFFKEKVYQNF